MLCSLKWNSMLPGVSTTFTRLPSSFTTDSSWHVAVIDESERCDLKSFNPKMLFPVALFPFPVLPTNTTVVAVAATGSHSFVRLSSERSSSSEVCSGTHSDGAASKFEPPMVSVPISHQPQQIITALADLGCLLGTSVPWKRRLHAVIQLPIVSRYQNHLLH